MDNIEELKQYVQFLAIKNIDGIVKVTIEDLTSEVLLQVATLPKDLEGEKRRKRIRNIALTVILEYRSKIKEEKSGGLCDAGMLGESLDEDNPSPDPGLEDDPTIDEDAPVELALARQEGEERQRKKRVFFHDRLHEIEPAVEAVERRGSVTDRLLLRVLRMLKEGDLDVEQALGILLVGEERMKDRDLRAALFQSLTEAYEQHPFVPASPVTMFPACGMSEAPSILPPGSTDFEKSQEIGRRVFCLTQGQLGAVCGFRDSEASLLKREEPDPTLDIEARRLEEQARQEIENRSKEVLARLEGILRNSEENPKKPPTM